MNYFELLAISPNSSLEEIKHAYHQQIKLWHPDRFAHDPVLRSQAEEQSKLINKAYHSLELFLSAGITEEQAYKPRPAPRAATDEEEIAAWKENPAFYSRSEQTRFASTAPRKAARCSRPRLGQAAAALLIFGMFSSLFCALGMPTVPAEKAAVTRPVHAPKFTPPPPRSSESASGSRSLTTAA